MQKSQADVIALVRSIHNRIKKYGIGRIEQKLQELSASTKNTRHNLIKSRIFEEISAVYGVAQKTILRSNRRGIVTQAKVTAIILFHRHLRLTQAQIAAIFGYKARGKNGEVQSASISSRLKAFRSLSAGGKALSESEKRFEKVYNKDFMNNFEQINKRITEFVNAETEPPKDWKKW